MLKMAMETAPDQDEGVDKDRDMSVEDFIELMSTLDDADRVDELSKSYQKEIDQWKVFVTVLVCARHTLEASECMQVLERDEREATGETREETRENDRTLPLLILHLVLVGRAAVHENVQRDGQHGARREKGPGDGHGSDRRQALLLES